MLFFIVLYYAKLKDNVIGSDTHIFLMIVKSLINDFFLDDIILNTWIGIIKQINKSLTRIMNYKYTWDGRQVVDSTTNIYSD